MEFYDMFDLSENKTEILDFLKKIRADYPDNTELYTKFLNIAKKKGIEFAQKEYDLNYNPRYKGGGAELEKSAKQKDDTKAKKIEFFQKKYAFIITTIKTFIKTNNLNDLIINVFFKKNISPRTSTLLVNKKYYNLFEYEISDILKFHKKYSVDERELISLEKVEMTDVDEYKKERGYSIGLFLTISRYLLAEGINKIDDISKVKNYLYYNVDLNINKDVLYQGKTKRVSNLAIDKKQNILSALGSKYHHRLLNENEFIEFLTFFLDIYEQPDTYFVDKARSNIVEQVLPKEKREEIIDDFVNFVGKKLSLRAKPKIVLSYDEDVASELKSFGRFIPETKELLVVMTNRNLADILRTIAHELVHYKQMIMGKLKPDSGKTGSSVENEANALAGILMREYGKNNPMIFE